jgi:hypothetical protein
MITVAIVRRRLKPGKTYDDFRRAWYHTTGFGTKKTMLTVLNALDPREIIVIGLTEAIAEQAPGVLTIDSAERKQHPLDELIEPQIERTFGVLVAEDDFSAAGPIDYQPATVGGAPVDLAELTRDIERGRSILARIRPDIPLSQPPDPAVG